MKYYLQTYTPRVKNFQSTDDPMNYRVITGHIECPPLPCNVDYPLQDDWSLEYIQDLLRDMLRIPQSQVPLVALH
jgi:hypothetical protein